MALYIKQNDKRSELQDRLAAELQERARQKAKEAELPDGVNDSQYIKGTKQTTPLLAVWIIIAAFVVTMVIWLIVASLSK